VVTGFFPSFRSDAPEAYTNGITIPMV